MSEAFVLCRNQRAENAALRERVAELEDAIYTRCRWYGPMMPIAEEIERKRNDR